MAYQLISSILAGKWFIHRQWAESQLPIVLALLQGKQVSFVQRTGNNGIEQPFVIDPATMDRYRLFAYDANFNQIPNPNIPPNSVGVLPITGPLTYYNGDCGEPGMLQRTGWLNQFNRVNSIGSIVQLIDTPGGESIAAAGYLREMKRSGKPILTSIDNSCYSLGMWFETASKETYVSNELAGVGSIGSYCMLADFSGYFEKQGIKVHEVYAPQSVDKNKDYRDALAGDYTAIQEDLRVMVDAFINHVANSRGDVAKANQKAWATGKTFYAEEAKSIGLIDGVKTLEQVVSKAAWLAKRMK